MEKRKKKEEIINRWRKIGFLEGIKSGSVNEWRCAKSFQNVTEYVIKLEKMCTKDDVAIQVLNESSFYIFPFIRRAITKDYYRVSRIIDGDEVFNFLKAHTIQDLMNFYWNNDKIKPKSNVNIIKLKVLCGIGQYLNLDNKTIFEALYLTMPETIKDENIKKLLNCFETDYFDVVFAMSVKYFNYLNKTRAEFK